MNLPADLFPSNLLWISNIVYFIWLAYAIWKADWRSLWRNSAQFNALVSLTLGVGLFWQLSAGVRPGFSFHLLGSTLFVLIFGWRVAVTLLSAIMIFTWFRTDFDFASLGLNGLTMIVVPVIFTEGLLRFSQRNLPKNPFLFTLLNGFACAGIVIALNVIATTAIFLLFSPYTWELLQWYYLPAAPILMFAEAFSTGMLITAFVVAQPEAVKNFSIADYLTGK